MRASPYPEEVQIIKSVINKIKSERQLKKWVAEINLEIEGFIKEHYRGRNYFNNKKGNLKYFSLKQVEFRLFYDCVWEVEVSEYEKGINKFSITLDDFYIRDTKRVMELLISCDTIQDVRNLDQRKSIYYD